MSICSAFAIFAWLLIKSGGWSRFHLSISSFRRSSCFKLSGIELRNSGSIYGGNSYQRAPEFDPLVAYARILTPNPSTWYTFWAFKRLPNEFVLSYAAEVWIVIFYWSIKIWYIRSVWLLCCSKCVHFEHESLKLFSE